MKTLKTLTLAILSALALTIANPVKAGTSEEIREARKVYLSLCIKDPICNQELENKKEEKRKKELAKLNAEIAKLKR